LVMSPPEKSGIRNHGPPVGARLVRARSGSPEARAYEQSSYQNSPAEVKINCVSKCPRVEIPPFPDDRSGPETTVPAEAAFRVADRQ
jgi:hypothetical protein